MALAHSASSFSSRCATLLTSKRSGTKKERSAAVQQAILCARRTEKLFARAKQKKTTFPPKPSKNNDKPILTINDVTVEEGSAAVFTVSLSNALDANLPLTLSLGTGGANSAEAGDVGAMVVTYVAGGTTYTLTPASGVYTVPAGVTTLTVTVPTTSDTV